MSGLPRNWRLSVNNQSGVNVDVVVKARFGKYASDGSVTWAAEAAVYSQTAIAHSSTAWTQGAPQDNSTNGHTFADLSISVTPASSATLAVIVQLEASTDGGTTFARQGGGIGLRACTTPSAVAGAQVYSARIR